MDVGTQALASFAVARAVVPRAPWSAWGVIVVAGVIANVDYFATMATPVVYLEWHRTYGHSILVSLIVDTLLAAMYLFWVCKAQSAEEPQSTGVSSVRIFGAVIFAGLLHLALDAGQSAGTMILWPFSSRRVAADWLPRVDPWIIAILIVAILLPELSRLVTDEIGAKSKKPRGRIGAIVGLVAVFLYVGVRADLHANAIAAMQSRTYFGDSPRRVAAYPEPASLITWDGIVETDRSLRQLTINALPGANFDPEYGVTLYKPESSPILDRAQQSPAAKQFLAIAQFPKASIEQIPEGYQIQIRDLRYAATGDLQHEIAAEMRLDSNGKLVDDELVWMQQPYRR